MLIAQMRGHEAAVKWGYKPAASLGAWTYDRKDGAGTLTAEIRSCDEFCLGQSPLLVLAPMGRALWRWRITQLQINGSTLVAGVVEQED